MSILSNSDDFVRSFLDCNGISSSQREEHDKIKEYVAKVSKVKGVRARSYWWSCITYCQEQEFEFALSQSQHWAYIYHDCDEGKEPHYHVLLHFDYQKTGTAVLNYFRGFANTQVEPCYSNKKGEVNPIGCYEYLTHKNDPDKYQYSSSRIVSHNPIYWEHFIPSVRDRTQTDFIEDLLSSNELDIVYMAKKYGRDFIKNYKAYMEFRHEVKMFERFKL